eukprot:6213746-Pleurochrysis_carterae.AAC.3
MATSMHVRVCMRTHVRVRASTRRRVWACATSREARARTRPHTTGESSPGPTAPGAHPSSAMWQMPHTSSSVVHVQLATACQLLIVTFIAERRPGDSQSRCSDRGLSRCEYVGVHDRTSTSIHTSHSHTRTDFCPESDQLPVSNKSVHECTSPHTVLPASWKLPPKLKSAWRRAKRAKWQSTSACSG